MELTKAEKQYLHAILKRELDHIKKDEATLMDFSPAELAIEDNYETFLEKLIRKLK